MDLLFIYIPAEPARGWEGGGIGLPPTLDALAPAWNKPKTGGRPSPAARGRGSLAPSICRLCAPLDFAPAPEAGAGGVQGGGEVPMVTRPLLPAPASHCEVCTVQLGGRGAGGNGSYLPKLHPWPAQQASPGGPGRPSVLCQLEGCTCQRGLGEWLQGSGVGLGGGMSCPSLGGHP